MMTLLRQFIIRPQTAIAHLYRFHVHHVLQQETEISLTCLIDLNPQNKFAEDSMHVYLLKLLSEVVSTQTS